MVSENTSGDGSHVSKDGFWKFGVLYSELEQR